MAGDPVSAYVLRLLRATYRGGRSSWSNYATITTGAQYRLLHRLCRQWIPSGGRVLDWGAGNGHASIYLSRAGYETTGYSFDGNYYADLLGEGMYRFVAADSSEPVLLPFADGEFDAVLSVGVLEHVRETGGDEVGSLREIRRVLRPGGVMICVHFPNAASWIEAFARLRGSIGHVYRYGLADVRRLFGASGFRIVRHGRYGALPRNQIARVIPTRLCDSEAFSRIYDAVDVIGAALLPWVAQNHYVVARSLNAGERAANRVPA
jgi:SAM-dependent methyltransferase